jgi:hypothetical protein
MFVIVHNDNVILGPMRWNAYRFQEVILDDCELEVTLDSRNDNESVITVNAEIKIYPVTAEPNPTFNPKTEFLHGPFWTYTDTQAVQSYQVEQLTVEAAKNFLKAQVSSARWTKENSGITVTINDIEYKFDTDINTRSKFHQYVTAGLTSVNWKLDQDSWIILGPDDINNIFSAITAHVQTAFDWENTKVTEINVATIETISNIDLT